MLKRRGGEKDEENQYLIKPIIWVSWRRRGWAEEKSEQWRYNNYQLITICYWFKSSLSRVKLHRFIQRRVWSLLKGWPWLIVNYHNQFFFNWRANCLADKIIGLRCNLTLNWINSCKNQLWTCNEKPWNFYRLLPVSCNRVVWKCRQTEALDTL